MKTFFFTLSLPPVAALLYHLGGIGKPFNTKYRDFGVPTCVVLWLALNGYLHWNLFFTYGLTFAAQTTYFDFVNKWFGKDDSEYWWNWFLVGLAFSLALILVPATNGHWMGFIYRTVVVTAFTTVWSEGISKDWLEEGGRGFIQVVTLPILFI